MQCLLMLSPMLGRMGIRLLCLCYGFLILLTFLMNFFTWNIRGTGSQTMPSLIRDLVARHNVSLLAIFETRVSGDRVSRIVRKIGFLKSFWVEAVGFSDAIWILWDDSVLNVDILSNHS